MNSIQNDRWKPSKHPGLVDLGYEIVFERAEKSGIETRYEYYYCMTTKSKSWMYDHITISWI